MCLGAFAGTGHWAVLPQGWAILGQNLDLVLHFPPLPHTCEGISSCPNCHCSDALKQLPAYSLGTQLRCSICRKLGNSDSLGQSSSFCRPALKQSWKVNVTGSPAEHQTSCCPASSNTTAGAAGIPGPNAVVFGYSSGI